MSGHSVIQGLGVRNILRFQDFTRVVKYGLRDYRSSRQIFAHKYTQGRTDRQQTDRQLHSHSDGQIDRHEDRQIGTRLDGQINRCRGD